MNLGEVAVAIALDAGQDVTGSSAAFVAPHAAGAGVRIERESNDKRIMSSVDMTSTRKSAASLPPPIHPSNMSTQRADAPKVIQQSRFRLDRLKVASLAREPPGCQCTLE